MKINKIKFLIILLLLLLLVVGCSSTSIPTKPDDIRQEIWDEGIKYYNLIQDRMNNNEKLTDDENEKFLAFIKEISKDKDTTENERKFFRQILDLATTNIIYHTNLLKQDREEKIKSKETFEKQTKSMQKEYGL